MSLGAKVLTTLTVIILLLSTINCPLPSDRETEYSPSNFIGGFSAPRRLALAGDDLYVLDSSNGIYKLDLATVDLSSDSSITSGSLIYNSDESGDAQDFDIENGFIYSILYNSDYYIMIYDLSNDTKNIFAIPDSLPAFNIDVVGNYIFFTGNMNMSLGVIKTDGTANYVFDQTNDFYYSKETLNPNDLVAVGGLGTKYIYVSAKGESDSGIDVYSFSDATPDKIDSAIDFNSYPFTLSYFNQYLHCSTLNKVGVYDITNNAAPMLVKEITVGENLGIYKTLQYNSKIAALYGYEMTSVNTVAGEYSVIPYWSGVKIISNPYTNSPVIEKNIVIKGWATDAVIYGGKLISANQSKANLTINNLD